MHIKIRTGRGTISLIKIMQYRMAANLSDHRTYPTINKGDKINWGEKR